MADAAYVVDNGLDVITALLIDGSGNIPKYVSWGTGSTGAAATDTAMETLAAPTTVTAETGTPTQQTTNTTNDTFQVVATITAAGSVTIKEVGIHDAATISGAEFFFHGTFDGIALSENDSIQFTLKSVFNQA